MVVGTEVITSLVLTATVSVLALRFTKPSPALAVAQVATPVVAPASVAALVLAGRNAQ
ncbi:MAG: hypothetical protein ACM309_08520 [Bacillota bacterium]